MRHLGRELTNAVEQVDWRGNPVQVAVCDFCFEPGCEVGGYVHLSRLGDRVLWSAPQAEERIEPPESPRITAAPEVFVHGALAIALSQWRRLMEVDTGVPSHDALVPATRRVLADAWRLSAPGEWKPGAIAEVRPALERELVGTDRMDVEEALTLLAPWLEWLAREPEAALEGELVALEAEGGGVETFYFDGGRMADWPALAVVDAEPLLALSTSLAYRPGAGERQGLSGGCG